MVALKADTGFNELQGTPFSVLDVPLSFQIMGWQTIPKAFLMVGQMMNQNLSRYATNFKNQNQDHECHPDLTFKLIKDDQVQWNLITILAVFNQIVMTLLY